MSLPDPASLARNVGRPSLSAWRAPTPPLDSEAVAKLAEEVERELAERYPDVGWSVTAVRDSLVTAPTPLTEIVDAARSRLLDERWTWSFT